MPRLEISTRRSPRGSGQHSFENLFGYRLIAERPHGPPTVHSFIHIHVVLVLSLNDNHLSTLLSTRRRSSSAGQRDDRTSLLEPVLEMSPGRWGVRSPVREAGAPGFLFQEESTGRGTR
jgi:hypothetical protein